MRQILTLWYDTWYGWGKVVESSETSFFGNGLFAELGFDEVHVPLEMVRDDQANAIAAIKANGPYEAVFIVPQHETLYILKDLAGGPPVIAWMTDDTWRHESFCKTWMGAADLIATTDAGSHAKYTEAGFKSVLTNWACRPEWEKFSKGVTRRAEAGMHGLLHGRRKELIAAIEAAGPVPVRMSSWNRVGQTETGLLSESGYHRSMAESEFSLCLTESSCPLPGGAELPRQMKGRMFEPQIHGSILVTEPAPRLAEYWEPGEECIVFDTPEEAQSEMARLLAEPFAAERMRREAKKRLLVEHTYAKRLTEILAAVDVKTGTAVTVRPSAQSVSQETVSVVMPIGDMAPETILFALLGLHRALPGGSEVLLGWYGTKQPESWLAGYAKRLEGRIVLAKAPNLSSCMNALIEAATGERLVIVSPDVLVTDHVLTGALKAKLPGLFWIPRTINLETGTDLAGPGGLQAAPYLLACRREDAIRCGGFDESYAEGLGYEGRDFCARLALTLGKFNGEWGRIAYRLPGLPLNGEHEAASERNRHITMMKWKGMPFGGSPTAFTVRAEIDTSGRRVFLCEAMPELLERAIRETKSPFVSQEAECR